jgi:hypothetical protein
MPDYLKSPFLSNHSLVYVQNMMIQITKDIKNLIDELQCFSKRKDIGKRNVGRKGSFKLDV